MGELVKFEKQRLDVVHKSSLALPLLLAIFTLFFSYDSIQRFALAAATTLILELWLWSNIESGADRFSLRLARILPLIMVFVGAVGLGASYSLHREEQALLNDPNHVASCSFNPIIACGSVITSDQGKTFGVSNPILGMVGYGGLILLGIGITLGVKLDRRGWLIVWFGSLFGFLYCLWLITQSLYVIGSLCLYCATIWAVTIPLFYYVTEYLLFKGHIKVHKSITDWLEKNHLLPMLITFVVIILLIYFNWSYYWNTVLK